MKLTLATVVAMLWHATAMAAAEPSLVAECKPAELLGYVPTRVEIEAHRKGALPLIEYRSNDGPGQSWGFDIVMRVDETGRVRCYDLHDGFGEKVTLNSRRRAWLQGLTKLHYLPFPNAQSPTLAIVTEQVQEVERVGQSRPLPDVSLEQVTIALERTACFGPCPSYTVEIRGDGKVTYVGRSFVDVEGKHRYQIPVIEVGKLVASLRSKNLWSTKTEYVAPVSDNPSYQLTITMGGQTHSIRDYLGHMVGMPPAISEFEREIDAAAKTDQWINLSVGTIKLLEKEGFDFASPAATALLWRAAMNPNGNDDQALVRLLQIGVRPDGELPEGTRVDRSVSLIEVALRNHRVGMADALIAAGALNTGGRPNQVKIDAAFRAALAGGRLAAVQRVWSAAGDVATPALSFDDSGEDARSATKRVPVTLLLEVPYRDTGWEGLKIAQWLAAHGCDLHASGADRRTLLHIAAGANDVAFVRYLLEQGVAAALPGQHGQSALGSTRNEDVAMLLLEAGTDTSRFADRGTQFREFAESNHWLRVVSWLDAHRE